MKLIFLGVSSFMAIGKDLFQSNMIIESENGQKLLIDCGSDIRHSLFAQHYNYNDIDAVYISHLHSDHIGGLEWLGFSNFFKYARRLPLYISNDQRTILWEHALSAGMSSLADEQATLDTYFQPQKIENDCFYWNNYQFKLVKTLHTMNNGSYLPSYGLCIQTKHSKIFITTDARFDATSLSFNYEHADVIFHDCEIGYVSHQHAQYEELNRLSPHIKHKIWLYSYANVPLPDAKKDGFHGFVQQGQVFDFT